MKKIQAVFFISALTLMILAGCQDEKAPVTSGITGSVTEHSDCKLFQAANLKFTEPDTFSCIYYSYDPANLKLNMQHINAGFNCCPEEIYCEIFTHNDTIIIKELEKGPECDCNCLFDLDIKVNNIAQYKYIIKFVETYTEGQEPLIFEMDLASGHDGDFCVARHNYPWGY